MPARQLTPPIARGRPASGASTPSDNRATKYSPLDQINKDNVASLRVAWRRPQVDPAMLAANPALRLSNRYTATPIMVDGVLYAPTASALSKRWIRRPARRYGRRSRRRRRTGCGGSAHRGVAYWGQGCRGAHPHHSAQYLFALNPKTGEPIADFGDGGKVDLNVGLGPLMKAFRWSGAARRPRRHRHGIVDGRTGLGAKNGGAARATSAPTTSAPASCAGPSTSFRTPARPATTRGKTIRGRYTGAGNVWSLMSADDDLGYVYLPTTSVDQRHVRRPPARRQPVQRASSCASTRKPASASGISRPCITICSTTTIRPRRFWPTSPSTAGRSRRSCR